MPKKKKQTKDNIAGDWEGDQGTQFRMKDLGLLFYCKLSISPCDGGEEIIPISDSKNGKLVSRSSEVLHLLSIQAVGVSQTRPLAVRKTSLSEMKRYWHYVTQKSVKGIGDIHSVKEKKRHQSCPLIVKDKVGWFWIVQPKNNQGLQRRNLTLTVSLEWDDHELES